MPPAASPIVIPRELLQEHLGIKVGDRVFFNFSLTIPKYNMGLVKEIYVQSNGRVVFIIWDEDKGMWRNLTEDRVFLKKPIHSKGNK